MIASEQALNAITGQVNNMNSNNEVAEALKSVAQDLQSTLAQIQGVTTQLSELSITIDALSKTNPRKASLQGNWKSTSGS